MKELLIYRNERLHCIIDENNADATIELLQDCFPGDSWDLRDKPDEREVEKCCINLPEQN